MRPVAPWVLGALLCLCGRAAANPLDAFGYGARAAALGSACAAVCDDASAGYYNPAALARGEDLQLTVGYQAAVPELQLSGARQPVEPTRGILGGLAVPARFGPVRFAFGVTLFLPDQHLSRLRVLRFDQPRLQLYDNRTQRLYFAANLALRLWRGLHLGGGLTFMSRTQGTVALRGTVAVGDPDDSALYSSTDVDLVAVRYPQAGLLWAGQRLSLAFVYRHRFVLAIDQGFDIQADIGNPGQEPVVRGASLRQRAVSSDLFQPWQLVAGAAWRPLTRLLLSLDLTFARWSEMPVPAATYDLSLDIGRLNDLVKLMPSRSYPPPGFYDTFSPALGVEWRVAEDLFRGRLALDLRGGYRYEPSPVPPQEGESSFGDADKHTFSLGGGATLARLGDILLRPVHLDLSLGVTWLPERAVQKADPRSPVGDFTVGGVVVQAGAQLRWRM